MEISSAAMTTTASTNNKNGELEHGGGAHVLLVPLPAQGHMNPMIQLGRRLAYHGLLPTLVTTRYVLSTSPAAGFPFPVAAISDGFDEGGMAGTDPVEYCRRLEAVGSETLARAIATEARAGRRPAVVVYDPHMPWAHRVAAAAGVPTAAFLSQSCAVDLVYGEAWAGRAPLPMRALRRRGAVAVDLAAEDLPPFVVAPELYPQYLKVSIAQFEHLAGAADVLVNSCRDLEPLEAEYMEATWRAKTVGPALPSLYLGDARLPSNTTSGVSFFSGGAPSPMTMEWLDRQPACSVVLASYGTVYSLDADELHELGSGLCDSGRPFVWVVRSGEAQKLSQDLADRCREKGLLVPWCPQLEVLSHQATGCFITHCGWNSATEAIVAGVPMVGMPRSADQPTTAKYMESVWRIGLRMRLGEKGLVKREEVERCIREVMEGERRTEFRHNAAKWMNKAKEAMQEGGSSDKNIAAFAAKYLSV